MTAAVVTTAAVTSASAQESTPDTTAVETTTTTSATEPAITTTTLAEDKIRPSIVSVQVSKPEVTYGEHFDVTIEATDNIETIVVMAVPRLVRQSSAGIEYVDSYDLCVIGEDWPMPKIVSGDSRNGAWKMTCVARSWIEPGTYVFMPFAYDSSNNSSYIKDTSENPEVWATVVVR